MRKQKLANLPGGMTVSLSVSICLPVSFPYRLLYMLYDCV